jgi:hypothetical protein
MRRTIVLGAFVAIGVVLVLVVEPPRRLTGRELARGPRAVRVSTRTVRAVDVSVATRRLVADRGDGGWRLGGTPVSRALGEALDALVDELEVLRAVDAFRATSLAPFGLDPPAGSIVVTTSHGVERLDLGTLNAAGSTCYARREGHPRVLQLGVYLLEVVRRVLDARDAGAGSVRAYWPEIG